MPPDVCGQAPIVHPRRDQRRPLRVLRIRVYSQQRKHVLMIKPMPDANLPSDALRATISERIIGSQRGPYSVNLVSGALLAVVAGMQELDSNLSQS
jgi:hypothetical protein